jgi:aspartyl/asparaginyl beta-hydroxylase (cupin superfamily)
MGIKNIELNRPAFYSLKDFPKLEKLAENWTIIRDEFLRLDPTVMDINRVNKSHQEVYNEILMRIQKGEQYGWVKGWGKEGENSDWIQYGILLNDFIEPMVKKTMPRTTKMLEKIKGIKVCALNMMKAGTILSCHRHPDYHKEGILQLHVGLGDSNEDNYAYLNVNGQFWQHLPGSAVIFDGSLDHFAFNASNTPRTILYMEFYKKELMSK